MKKRQKKHQKVHKFDIKPYKFCRPPSSLAYRLFLLIVLTLRIFNKTSVAVAVL